MIFKSKETKLFVVLACFFIANAVIAEFIGVKIFSVENTLGLRELNLSFLGFTNLSLNMSAGVLNWPIVFIMTDIINEYYGRKGVRNLSVIAVVLICYAFLVIYLSIQLTPSGFWINKQLPDGTSMDMNRAYNSVLGQGLWIIIGSVTAFFTSQLIDVTIFHQIKKLTGEKGLWLRATGSTVFSQLIDSFVVIFIAFYIGGDWTFKQIIAVGSVGYIYKFIVAICLTPVLYIIHQIIDAYLGKDLAHRLMKSAQEN
jgi:queuosine precursor transporter